MWIGFNQDPLKFGFGFKFRVKLGSKCNRTWRKPNWKPELIWTESQNIGVKMPLYYINLIIRLFFKVFSYWVMLQGVVCSGVAYYVQGIVIKQRGPVFVTAFNPLCMIVTAVMGSIILKEEITLGRYIYIHNICVVNTKNKTKIHTAVLKLFTYCNLIPELFNPGHLVLLLFTMSNYLFIFFFSPLNHHFCLWKLKLLENNKLIFYIF